MFLDDIVHLLLGDHAGFNHMEWQAARDRFHFSLRLSLHGDNSAIERHDESSAQPRNPPSLCLTLNAWIAPSAALQPFCTF